MVYGKFDCWEWIVMSKEWYDEYKKQHETSAFKSWWVVHYGKSEHWYLFY